MKKILIAGANSFLGNSTKRYLENYSNYKVDILDMHTQNWKTKDFSIYDVIINVCAIVHRPKEKDIELYYKVNRDLAFEIAKKAKDDHVNQFIQISTDGVFGIELGEMSCNKGFNPITPYEKSKYEADLLIEKLRYDNFSVCIIRPPMIYGKGCKGNFPRLEKFALNFPIFPSIKNKRDFIYIDNICDFIKYAIDKSLNEICYPRNNELISVSEMVKKISKYNGKRMLLCSIFNPIIRLFYKRFRTLKSVFGDCYCTEPICKNGGWAAPISFDNSLKRMYGE